MTPIDPINMFSSWSVMRGLRNSIRRIMPMESGHRHLKMPVLETERLLLRKLDQEDLKGIIAWEAVPGAQNTEVEAQEFLEYCFREYRERGIGPWGMQLKETGAIVGNCGFPHIVFKNRCAEVNYDVTLRHRGKGLAPEALNALLKFGFRDIDLIRIQARCDPGNLSSERVMLKAGMRFEGLIEESLFSKDTNPKQKLYAISADDFNRSATHVYGCQIDGAEQSDGSSEIPAKDSATSD
jgi:[ribosomal protein S5]-alanine N-acetyltransferase